MLPRYFHYIEPADPLSRVLDRFMHRRPFTTADRLLLKKHAAEKNPSDDRIRRIARALLALTADRKTTYDYPPNPVAAENSTTDCPRKPAGSPGGPSGNGVLNRTIGSHHLLDAPEPATPVI
jgi:hypothetical protein